MNQKLKRKWVAALRSGKYEQGKGTLSNQGKHCCLGVLCKVVGLRSKTIPMSSFQVYILPKTKEKVSGSFHSMGDLEKYIGYEEFGLSQRHHDRLINLNDNSSKGFSHIADWIERYV